MRRIAVGVLIGVLVLAMQTAAGLAAPSAGAVVRAPVKPKPSAQPPPAAAICAKEPRGSTSPGTVTPWAQQQLNFADAWRFSRSGAGVTVAVVDSGVSANSPQLGARLAELQVTGTSAELDCVGHGTGVAGIIAAAVKPGNPFHGVAPAADILSVKVTDSGSNVDCGQLATGIQDAVNQGARVINVSVQCGVHAAGLGELRNAVRLARDHDVVIVAAAGNDTNTGGTPPFYPANYSANPAVFPNVLSVGAVQQDGTLLSVSDRLTHVSVAAPGANILTMAPAGTFQGPQNINGTSYAAPFVSGVAALVIDSHPNLTAAQVVSRIIATADGGTGTGTGAGMVDPLQAVTALLPAEGQAVTSSVPTPPSPVAVPRAPAPDTFTRMLIVSVTGGSLAAAALVVAAALVIPAGRRRGWRPGRAEPIRTSPPSMADDLAP
ncbi:MAG: S8 family serine peptidase [Micromonosporaceae bacterium]